MVYGGRFHHEHDEDDLRDLYFSASMQASREMYGKSYFSLGAGERAALDQMVLASVASNFQNVTPEKLASQSSTKPAGFHIEPPPEENTP
jgi:hypothetical protein